MLKDGKVDEAEQAMLKDFFEDFIEYSFAKQVRTEAARVKAGMLRQMSLPGICATCPDVRFAGRTFTLTGTSAKATRKDIVGRIAAKGGEFSPNVTERTHYLVVGSGANPCWAFSCYGRKVEKAVELRKSGVPIVIVHETDFWDAMAEID